MQLFVDANFLSPYAMSVFVALREKHVPFEVVSINLQRDEHLSAAYSRVSDTRRVPSIVDNSFSLSESSAICEYIEDQYPGVSLYPTGIRAKAKARQIQAWLRSDFMPIREERSTEVVFLKRSPPPLSTAAQRAAGKLFNAIDALLPQGEENLFGQWSIADTDLALMLNRHVLGGDEVPERLGRYARAPWQRATVQEWVNMQRPLE